MHQRVFEQQNEALWQQVEQHLNALEKTGFSFKKKEKPLPLHFPRLYRQICYHLALAQSKHYSPHLIAHLNQLVLRGHQQLYQQRRSWLTQFFYFISSTFPNAVRQQWKVVLSAFVLFWGVFLACAIGLQYYPDSIYYVLSHSDIAGMEDSYNPKNGYLKYERNSDSDLMMFGYYIYHNIGIAFQCYASGILLGLGTLFFLLFNAVILGFITGHLIHLGFHEPFFSFVIGHSAWELTAIILSSAAGFQLGIALLHPKRFSRLQALQQAALDSAPLMYGSIMMLVIAAFIEAFWSSYVLDYNSKYIIGAFNILLVIFYFWRAGRSTIKT